MGLIWASPRQSYMKELCDEVGDGLYPPYHLLGERSCPPLLERSQNWQLHCRSKKREYICCL